MANDLKQKSLGELEALYKRKRDYWLQKKREYESKVAECQREIAASEAQLRHVQALTGGSPAAPTVAPVARRRKTKQRRQRRSPVREAALAALRKRAGERLTTKQLMAAIREDTRKKVSRQAVNVNVGVLEKQGLIRREPAPRKSGARFVYSAK